MLESISILSALLFAVSLCIFTRELLTPHPGRASSPKDLTGDLGEIKELKASLADVGDELEAKAVRMRLMEVADRHARWRYRRYPSGFARHAAAGSMFLATAISSFAVSFLLRGLSAACAVWSVFGFACFLAALAFAVAIVGRAYYPHPVRAVRGREFTKDSADHDDLFLEMDGVFDVVDGFGEYSVVDARPYYMTLEYPLEGSIAYYEGSGRQGESAVYWYRDLDTKRLCALLPGREAPVFVVSLYGEESCWIASDLRAAEFRHAYDLGGIANDYGRAARLCYMLRIVYGEALETAHVEEPFEDRVPFPGELEEAVPTM